VAHDETRFHTDGPDTERHLALVFHEVVTNASKYGALSKPDGRVLISWKEVEGVIRLEWRQEGGPLVTPPERQGFGSRSITESHKTVSGSITPIFAPEGLRCSITFRT
jgi:two-component sensor histidine kinase